MQKKITYNKLIKHYFAIRSFETKRRFRKKIKKENLLCDNIESLNKKSHVFCMAPWVHFHLVPSGVIVPCCLAPYNVDFGNVHEKQLIEIWNSPLYLKLRRQMILGKKSEVCKECYEYESINKYSLRMYFNKTYKNEFSLVKATQVSGYLKKMKIRHFDARFSNICNFRCRGCGPALSSSWHDDAEQLFECKIATQNIINCTENGSNHVWDQLAILIPELHEISFAGGEPLLTEEHYKVLNILLENRRTNVVLSYITNLSTINFKHRNILALWKKFPILNITVSVDDIGKRGEYYRKGMKWDNLIHNLLLLKENVPHAVLKIMLTVNLLNIFYIPEIYQFFISGNYVETENFSYNILKEPQWYNIQILPPDFKKKVKEKLVSSIALLKAAFPNKNLWHYENMIEVIINFLFKKDYPFVFLEEFKYRNQKLDKIRNECFEEIYPELAFITEYNWLESRMSK